MTEEKHSILCEKCQEPILTWFGNVELKFGPQFEIRCTKCGTSHKVKVNHVR